jgi:hypothetical protein
MSTFKVLPDFGIAMRTVREYVHAVFEDEDHRAHIDAAAEEAGWTDVEKAQFLVALVKAVHDLREKPH